jgi:predicted transcriptional regulator YdeE
MQPTIINKKFMLVGYEISIDEKNDFSVQMNELRLKLKKNIGRIKNRIQTPRLIGWWKPDPNTDYSDPENHSKRKYFFGIEVSRIENIPHDFVFTDLPESEFAFYREKRRGGHDEVYDWMIMKGYKLNELLAIDFEIFDNWDKTAEDSPCDILVPIVKK